jgi:hypothetical protein
MPRFTALPKDNKRMSFEQASLNCLPVSLWKASEQIIYVKKQEVDFFIEQANSKLRFGSINRMLCYLLLVITVLVEDGFAKWSR